MRRTLVGAVVLAALWVMVLVLAAPVAAFSLTNCTMQATSSTDGGGALDSVQGGATDATQQDPFLVDWNGTVAYTGGSNVAMLNNHWGINVFIFPTPLQGGDPNTADSRTGNGTVGVSANAPFRFTGLYYVSGTLTGSGGTCTGNGWFKVAGDPVGTIPFFGGIVVLILGVLLLVFGARGHLISAIVGGILTGFGATTMLVIYSTLPVAELTPLVVLLVGLIVGIAVGLLGRRARGPETPPMLPPSTPPTPA